MKKTKTMIAKFCGSNRAFGLYLEALRRSDYWKKTDLKLARHEKD